MMSVVLVQESESGSIILQNEVDLLSKIHHPNIISLLGHTSEISSSFIVYELMEKGSLEAQLHGKKHDLIFRPGIYKRDEEMKTDHVTT